MTVGQHLPASIEQRVAGSGQWAAVGTGREGGREGKMEGGRKGGLCKTTNLVFARVLCQQVARSRSRATQVRLALPHRPPLVLRRYLLMRRAVGKGGQRAAGNGQRAALGSGIRREEMYTGGYVYSPVITAMCCVLFLVA